MNNPNITMSSSNSKNTQVLSRDKGKGLKVKTNVKAGGPSESVSINY